MAHIKCRYYKARCQINYHNECNYDYDNCRCETDNTDCDFVSYQYTEFEKSIRNYELYGNEKSYEALDGKSILCDVSLWLGKTYIDNIVYLEIDGRIIVDNSVEDDGTHLTTEFVAVNDPDDPVLGVV